mgnify:CR=1 FL=1
MRILKFKKQSKDKYKLYLDDNSDITLYEDVIIKNNLLITKEISDELLEALKKQNNDIYAYTLALGYISVKMRSIKEINDYLKNACQDIKKSQIMVIQTDKVPSNKKMGHKNIKKIVKNICESIEEDTGILIDETEEKIGEISIVHIEEFTTEMAKFMEENDELSRGELEKKLSERIKGIFDEI